MQYINVTWKFALKISKFTRSFTLIHRYTKLGHTCKWKILAYVKVGVKVKLSHKKSWNLGKGIEIWASTLTLTFGTASTAQLSAVGASRTLPPRKFVKIGIPNWKMNKEKCGILSFIRQRCVLISRSSGTRHRVGYQIETFWGSLLSPSSGSNNLIEISQKVYAREQHILQLFFFHL